MAKIVAFLGNPQNFPERSSTLRPDTRFRSGRGQFPGLHPNIATLVCRHSLQLGFNGRARCAYPFDFTPPLGLARCLLSECWKPKWPARVPPDGLSANRMELGT